MRHVHHRHARNGEVEARGPEEFHQFGGISTDVADPERFLPLVPKGGGHHSLRPIHPGDLCPEASENAREVPLSTPNVEYPDSAHRTDDAQQGRSVKEVAVVVVPFLDEAVPFRGHRVPAALGVDVRRSCGDSFAWEHHVEPQRPPKLELLTGSPQRSQPRELRLPIASTVRSIAPTLRRMRADDGGPQSARDGPARDGHLGRACPSTCGVTTADHL